MSGSADPGGVRRAVDALLSVLFPDACLACGQPLAPAQRHVCSRCWSEVTAAAPRNAGRADVGEGSPVHFVLPFDGPVRALIHALKYDARTSIARVLAEVALPATLAVADGRVDAVVPVPLHGTRLRERGFNQAELIALRLARGLGVPLRRGLVRTKPTTTHTALGRRERFESTERAFAPLPSVAGERILLVDDVVTTGATLAAAARAARRGGAEAVIAMAIAAQKLPPLSGQTRRNRLTHAGGAA